MDHPLTRTQLEIVVLVANGYRNAEIAEMTHRSESSIKKTLNTARQRAGANTLPHLVSIVIASGVLAWTDDERRIQDGEEPASLPVPSSNGSSCMHSPQAAA
jgi:DNA-binding CsgD family transcriptional regulator